MKIFYIPDWQRLCLRCRICGTKKSVKYNDEDGFCLCNRCALNIIGESKTDNASNTNKAKEDVD